MIKNINENLKKKNNRLSPKSICIIRLSLLLIPILLGCGIGYLFWKFVFIKVTNLTFIVGICVAIYLITILIVMAIVTPKFREKHLKALIVWNSIVLLIGSVLWSFFIQATSDFLNFALKVSLNVDEYWKIYLVPAINVVATIIAFTLMSIKDKSPKYWKLNVSIVIGALASLSLTLTYFIKQLVVAKFMTPEGWFTLFGLLTSIVTMIVEFVIATRMVYSADKGEIALDTIWAGMLIVCGITSLFGIVANLIPLILLVVLGGGGVGGGSGGGGRGGHSGGKKNKEPLNTPYYDLTDEYGNRYHTNHDGTVTKSDGSVWMPKGDGSYTKL